MDQRHLDQGIIQRNVATEDIICGLPCLGFVIQINADEWSQFALGQLVALGIATFILTLVVLVHSLCASIG
jgi:hypothetical protein